MEDSERYYESEEDSEYANEPVEDFEDVDEREERPEFARGPKIRKQREPLNLFNVDGEEEENVPDPSEVAVFFDSSVRK